MSQQESNPNGDIIKDFQSTGRTGRRNAVADVHGAHKDFSTSDLPLKLEKLTTRGKRIGYSSSTWCLLACKVIILERSHESHEKIMISQSKLGVVMILPLGE